MSNKAFLSLGTCLFLMFFIVSCNTPVKKTEKEPDVKQEETQKVEHPPAHSPGQMTEHELTDDCSKVHWGYEGEEAPEHWPHLCTGFTSCGGKAQSPIDIKDAKAKEGLSPLTFNYSSTSANILNNGHTVQFNIDGVNRLTIGDKTYSLLQFHFHALSEHKIEGEHYPLEAHFVHKHSETDYAVIGIMFEEGAENELLKKYLEHFPKEKGNYTDESSINLASLLPENHSYYYYNGSLTTPPCSEVVNWYVLKTPVTATKEQLDACAEILHENYRPVMPTNEREVVMYTE